MSDKQLRVGIGKLDFKSVPSYQRMPWYVTIYNRELSVDRAQGWFETYAEAAAYSRSRIPLWKSEYTL